MKVKNEIWKDIPCFEGLYQISNLGRVKSLERVLPHKTYGTWKLKEKILKPSINGAGYLFVILFDKNKVTHNKRIHRLVAEIFVKNEDKNKFTQVDHIDCNKLNNKFDNLEWVTPLENTRRAINNNLIDYSSQSKNYCKKKVVCVETGEIFNSVKEAAISIGAIPTNLSQSCIRGIACRGLHFKYYGGNNNE